MNYFVLHFLFFLVLLFSVIAEVEQNQQIEQITDPETPPKCIYFGQSQLLFELRTEFPKDVEYNSPRRNRTDESNATKFDIYIIVSNESECNNDGTVFVVDSQSGQPVYQIDLHAKVTHVLTLFAHQTQISSLLLVGNVSGILYDEMVVEIKEKFAISSASSFRYVGPHSWIPGKRLFVDATFGRGTYPTDNKLFKAIELLDETDWKLTVGSFCSLSPITWYAVHSAAHQYQRPSTYPFAFFSAIYPDANDPLMNSRIPSPQDKSRHLHIGNDVWIGAEVTIINGVSIGDGAVIGARSVVRADIPAYAIAVGNPAQIVKYRFSEEIITKLLQIRWWDWTDEEIITRMSNHSMVIEDFVELYYNVSDNVN